MTVKELIEELNKMTQDKRVDLTSLTTTLGEAKRVIEHNEFVEIETDMD